MGLDPRMQGSCPEPTADAQGLSHPGAPQNPTLKLKFIYRRNLEFTRNHKSDGLSVLPRPLSGSLGLGGRGLGGGREMMWGNSLRITELSPCLKLE